MVKVLVCDNDDNERVGLMNNILYYYQKIGAEVQLDDCSGREELLKELKRENRDIVVVAINGVEGMETAIGAGYVLPKNIVWISDLDFAVQSYRMGVTYFLQKPLRAEQLYQALEQCAE